jgi:type I restriction enzyme S subunit
VPHFIRLYLESRYSELRGVAQGGGSTKGALTCSFFKSYLVPQPPRVGQEEIASALLTIEKKISIHERNRTTLRDLFKTMLHQLITGQIRVDQLDVDISEVTSGAV